MTANKVDSAWGSDKPHTDFFYKAIRDQIEHEDHLCNNRMTWLITLQAFLFSAYGFSLSAQAVLRDGNSDLVSIINNARLCFAAVGVASSLAILAALGAATLSISRLVAKWYKVPAKVRSRYPQIIGNSTKDRPGGTRLGQLPLFTIPVVSIVLWAIISYHPTFQWIVIWLIVVLIGGGILLSAGIKIGQQIAETEKSEKNDDQEEMERDATG